MPLQSRAGKGLERAPDAATRRRPVLEPAIPALFQQILCNPYFKFQMMEIPEYPPQAVCFSGELSVSSP